MRAARPTLCLVSTTPLAIHFFLKAHVVKLSRYFDVTLVFNAQADTYLPPLGLPVQEVHVPIERKITPWRDLWALFGLIRLMGARRYDVVLSVVPKAGLLGMIAASLVRTPTRIHIFQGEVWASRRGWIRQFLKIMDSLTARLATHILAVSRSEGAYLEQEGVVAPDQVTVIGAGSICGVDTGRFKPDPNSRERIRAELGIPTDAVICIFVGRLTADKGVIDLAHAFTISAADRPEFWLLVVGPDEESIGESVRASVPPALADRILLRGFSDSPEHYFAAADFLCLPSYREGFGMVIMEAAAAGIPAVGTRIHGITDAIHDELTGALVPVADVEALAAALSRMVDDPQRRQRLADAACRRAVDEFEQAQVVSSYVRFILRAAGETACP
jgi:glycosyltransferase involved in cell wall biosynthesis